MIFQKQTNQRRPISNKHFYMPTDLNKILLSDRLCAFTGHRPQKLQIQSEKDGQALQIKKMLREEILKALDEGYTEFISGMVLGTDLWAAEIALHIKLIYNIWNKDIRLYAAIPFLGQDNTWPEDVRERYYNVLNRCDGIFCLSETISNDAYLRRNDFMVEHAAKLIAVYNGSEGGTDYTIKKAKQKGIDITLLLPDHTAKKM